MKSALHIAFHCSQNAYQNTGFKGHYLTVILRGGGHLALYQATYFSIVAPICILLTVILLDSNYSITKKISSIPPDNNKVLTSENVNWASILGPNFAFADRALLLRNVGLDIITMESTFKHNNLWFWIIFFTKMCYFLPKNEHFRSLLGSKKGTISAPVINGEPCTATFHFLPNFVILFG